MSRGNYHTTATKSLFTTKTFLFSFLIYINAIYPTIVDCIYKNKLEKQDVLIIIASTMGILGVSNSRLRINDDIQESASKSTPIGLVTTPEGIPGLNPNISK